jgi:Protein of unknown function (DUF4019)
MRRTASLVLLSTLVSSALALTASNDDEAARQSALEWLQVIDSGNYKDAALMISNYARESRDWPNYLVKERAPLGRARHRQIAGVQHAAIVAGDPETRQHAILRFKCAFEKIIAIEEIVVARTGCCWEIFDYKILPAQKP